MKKKWKSFAYTAAAALRSFNGSAASTEAASWWLQGWFHGKGRAVPAGLGFLLLAQLAEEEAAKSCLEIETGWSPEDFRFLAEVVRARCQSR